MPRTKGVNYTKDERRDMILRGGLVTFCRMGFDGANIDDIAKEAGCSHGLIYYYFKNKEEIFRELVRISSSAAEQFGLLVASEDAGTAPEARLRDMAERTLALVRENENIFYYFQFSTVLKLLKKDLSYLGIEPPKYLPYDAVKAVIVAGQRSGAFFEGDADAYANLYIAVMQGLANRKAFTEKGGHPPFVMPSVDMLMRLFVK